MKTRMCSAGSNSACSLHGSGLTLLELLVVLVIASLMLALVAPNIGSVLPGAKLKGFALQSTALLQELESEAFTRAEVRTLELAMDDRRYRVNGVPGPVWPAGISVELGGGLSGADMMADEPPQLVFYPDGSSNGGLLLLSQNEGRSYSIRVDAFTGKVSLDE